MKNENYIIKVEGISAPNSNNTEFIKTTTKGNYFFNGKNAVITYNEPDTTGFENCNTIITIHSNKKLEIKRYGKFKSIMTIENNKRNICNYKTSYGDFLLGVTGKAFNINLYKNSCNLTICYELDINNSLLHLNKVIIKCNKLHAPTKQH